MYVYISTFYFSYYICMQWNKRAVLVILDGWGMTQDHDISAVAQAHTPVFDSLRETYPHAQLITHGERVWLPKWQMWNSEVWHMHLWAWRILYQDLVKISRACDADEIIQHPYIQKSIERSRIWWSCIHIFALCSDGGVHSHIDHICWLIDVYKRFPDVNVVLHLMSDGRDVWPKQFLSYYDILTNILHKIDNISIGTIIGRYRAMDRDKHRERIRYAYDAYVSWVWHTVTDVHKEVLRQYTAGITDEFLEPIIVDWYAPLSSWDTLVCANFRTDRCRQLVTVFSQKDMPIHGMKTLPVHVITMTEYDKQFTNVSVLFPKDPVKNTLWELLEKAWRTQFRIAETEKYPHVTYFFGGWKEAPCVWEQRLVIPSPSVATYDMQPEMSAQKITDETIAMMKKSAPDFICLNYANPDMVGHTWDMDATITAVETVDRCLWSLVWHAIENWYDLIILSDHGNAECMLDADGEPQTAHTINPVPCIYVWKKAQSLRDWASLIDVAPTLCEIMSLEQVWDMTGKSLFPQKK